MKKKWTIAAIIACVLLAVSGGTLIAVSALGNEMSIVLDGELTSDSTVEYTGEAIQFPMAHVENGMGQIVSYDVNYKVINEKDKSEVEDEYALFDLKTGDYKLVYTYNENKSVSKKVSFSIKDTTNPVIEFTGISNGLFLQDLDEEELKSQKLPLYTIDDASMGDGIDLKRTLYFKGEDDADYVEHSFREINGSYEITEFGNFKYELTATDVHGNSTTQTAEWKVKDRDWKPTEALTSGYLADYASEGYTNYIEGGDANQYYMIGNDYTDEWLEEYEGAKGVFKMDMGFNTSAGYGNNTIKLHFANSFTQKDIEGKYLAVRMRVEGDNLKEDFLFGGNNVEFRTEDATTRAFTTSGGKLEFGEWKTYYIDATTVQAIGMYPNGRYNSNTTFYEGGDPATCLQLCFSRKAGYFNNMTLYIDSISLAEKLPETEVAISGTTASWKAVDGAAGYKVNINGEETVITDTKIAVSGKKGYVRVTPLGDGALTLDGEEATAVYGIDPGNKLAAFDDELYIDLFSDKLNFSTESEHKGYQPQSYTGTYTKDGVTLELATGNWGIVTGIKLLFPETKAKGDNTTLVMNMNVSNDKYGLIRVYDYDGQLLQSIPLTSENTGRDYKFEIDLAGYDKELKGLQFIFGPKSFTPVADGVTVKFKDIYYVSTYYDITVNGLTLTCAGEKELNPIYTLDSLVQFGNVYNFGVAADDTPLSFEGTVLLDGKKVGSSAFSVVGYPNTDTICFKIPHAGKVLTIMKDSVIYHNGMAIKVAKTFNAKWNGSEWVEVANVPAPPEDEYVTVDGSKKLVANKTALTPGYTQSDLVQFTNVNDFGVTTDDTPLGFEGTVLLDGAKVSNVNFVGYKDNTTICLKVPHNGKLLTIMKDSIIYYEDQAVIVTETFNAKWDGSKWVTVSQVPEVPNDEYITVGGSEKLVVNKTALTPGYTQVDLVQFTNVNDYGVSADDTPLGFEGIVLLDGVEVENVNIAGYLNSTTVCLKVPHNGKVLTVMKDSVIYYGEEAVIVTETFNAKWDGSQWAVVDEIPTPPEKEYVDTSDGQKELIDKVTLTAGYTADSLVQFTNVYDFGVAADNTPLAFEGTILLDGVEVATAAYNIVGYTSTPTICLNIAHKDKVLTIMKDSVIYYGDKAVIVNETFNAKWAGQWIPIDEIPTPDDGNDDEQIGELTFEYRYGTNNLIQVNTNLPSTTPIANFTTGQNGCSIDESANQYQQVGWIQMDNADGTIVLTFHFNSVFETGQTYVLPKGAVFGFTDENQYTLDKDYTFKFDGSNWAIVEEAEQNELTFAYRYGADNLIQVNTNLPSTTPIANFTTGQNGCSIDESANQYQQVGWIQMDNADGTIVLTFHFNSAFETGQTYVLPKGAVFGFTDESTYVLDKDYTFTFDGTSWTMTIGDTNETENTLYHI